MNRIVLLLFLIGFLASCGSKNDIKKTNAGKHTNLDKNAAQQQLPDSGIVFSTLNDSLIIATVLGNRAVFDADSNYWKVLTDFDSLTMTLAVHKLHYLQNDTIYRLILRSGEIYHDCNMAFVEEEITLKKQANGWLVTNSGSGMLQDPEKCDELDYGPYFVSHCIFDGSHCEGLFFAGENWGVHYKGKYVGGFSATLESNSSASGMCTNMEDDPEWVCTCTEEEGSGHLTYNKALKYFVFTSETTRTQLGNKDCSPVSKTKRMITQLLYQDTTVTVSEIFVDEDGKKKKLIDLNPEKVLKQIMNKKGKI